MSVFPSLLRRELWEHRAFIYVPAVTIVLVLGSVLLWSRHLVGALELGLVHVNQIQPQQLEAALASAAGILATFFAMFMIFVVFFYLVDCLYAEREDRSILFWKSLPISDTQTVLSKLTVAMAIAPAMVLGATIICYLLLLVLFSVYVGLAGGSPWGILWAPNPFGETLGFLVYALVVQTLWYFPLFAWLLMVSAYAKRAVVLWAVLPPIGVIWLEQLLFSSDRFAHLIGDRLGGVFPLAFRVDVKEQVAILPGGAELHFGAPLSELIDPWPFIVSPSLWLGLLVGAVFVVAAILLRRYRDESL